MHGTGNISVLLLPLLFSIVLTMPFFGSEEIDNIEIDKIPDNDEFAYSKNRLQRSSSVDPKYVVTRGGPHYNFGLGKRSKPFPFALHLNKGLINPNLISREKLYDDLYQGINNNAFTDKIHKICHYYIFMICIIKID